MTPISPLFLSFCWSNIWRYKYLKNRIYLQSKSIDTSLSFRWSNIWQVGQSGRAGEQNQNQFWPEKVFIQVFSCLHLKGEFACGLHQHQLFPPHRGHHTWTGDLNNFEVFVFVVYIYHGIFFVFVFVYSFVLFVVCICIQYLHQLPHRAILRWSPLFRMHRAFILHRTIQQTIHLCCCCCCTEPPFCTNNQTIHLFSLQGELPLGDRVEDGVEVGGAREDGLQLGLHVPHPHQVSECNTNTNTNTNTCVSPSPAWTTP